MENKYDEYVFHAGMNVRNGLTLSDSTTNQLSITGGFTTGLTISGDGTTAISVTNGFSGTNILSLAGSASGSGLAISGACATPVNITGAFTTGLTIAADGTTGISITSAFSGVTGISLAGTGSSAGINISGNHTTGITIAAQTTAGVAVTGATATGLSVTGACTTAALQMGVSGTTAGDFIWYGTTALYKVLFDADGDTNGAVYMGADTKGLMFKLYGDTTGCGVFWDPSTDTNGTLSIGASGGSKGNDVLFYGATNGCSCKWDQSEDQLVITQTNAATTGVERSLDVSQTHTGIGASAEVFRAYLTTNTIAGTYINAIFGKLDLATTGGVTGLAGVICGELTMPGGAIAGGVGTYAVFEAEINCPTSYSATVPIHVFSINAWGAAVTQFDQYGYLFDLTGVTSGSGNIWYDNQKAAPAVEEFIRVKTPAGVRYIGLYNANA